MAKNYIPFAARETFHMTQGEVRAAKVTAMAVSSKIPGNHIIWQDMCIWFPSLSNQYTDTTTQGYESKLLMRYGQRNKSYMVDRPMPVAAFINKGRPMLPVWKFERPYTLYPSEALNSRILQGGIPQATPQGAQGVRKGAPGIVFNCVREKDGRPHLLHASIQETLDVGAERPLTGTFMKCPSDSPIHIYGVGHHQCYNYDSDPTNTVPLGLEIYGPNGQSWLHRIIDPNYALTDQFTLGAWVDPPNSLIELGVERGWRTEMSNPLAVEFMFDTTTDAETYDFVLTVRGHAEVDHG